MPKKAKSSKNDIKQKQTQKQIVNVNINQSKTTKKRKPSENKKAPRKQIIFDSSYGQPTLGNPSNNLYYNSPPVIAQVIPPFGGQTNSLLPPNNSSIENILKSIKDKTDKLMRPSKKLVDSGTNEIFNMEPKKKLELKQEKLITVPRGSKLQIPARREPPFKLTGEIVQRKNTDMQTDVPKRRSLSDSVTSVLYTQEPKLKTVSSVATEANVKTPSFKEMVDASTKIKTAVKGKIYSKDYNEYIPEYRAADKLKSAMKAKIYPEKLKEFQAVNKTLGPMIKQSFKRNKYIVKRDRYIDRKEENKLNTLEAQTSYIENVLKQVDEKHKGNEMDKLIKKSIKNNAATNLQKVVRGHSIRKKIEKEKLIKPLAKVLDINVSKPVNNSLNILKQAKKSDKNMNDILQGLQMQNKIPDFIKKDTGGILQTPQKQEKSAVKIQKVIRGNASRKDTRNDILNQASNEKQAATTLQKVVRGHTSRKETEKLKQQVELMKPVELFGGTRSGTIIHPEASAPPQPLFGKDIDKTINNNFDKIKSIYSKEPKSYAEVIQANKDINVYKQNISRIKKRNGKSILSADQIQLKEDTLKEIMKLKNTYNKIYKEFYKTQQPKRGRKPKA